MRAELIWMAAVISGSLVGLGGSAVAYWAAYDWAPILLTLSLVLFPGYLSVSTLFDEAELSRKLASGRVNLAEAMEATGIYTLEALRSRFGEQFKPNEGGLYPLTMHQYSQVKPRDTVLRRLCLVGSALTTLAAVATLPLAEPALSLSLALFGWLCLLPEFILSRKLPGDVLDLASAWWELDCLRTGRWDTTTKQSYLVAMDNLMAIPESSAGEIWAEYATEYDSPEFLWRAILRVATDQEHVTQKALEAVVGAEGAERLNNELKLFVPLDDEMATFLKRCGLA